jgi:hypothetical protein
MGIRGGGEESDSVSGVRECCEERNTAGGGREGLLREVVVQTGEEQARLGEEGLQLVLHLLGDFTVPTKVHRLNDDSLREVKRVE